jgi:hypothetical protein
MNSNKLQKNMKIELELHNNKLNVAADQDLAKITSFKN